MCTGDTRGTWKVINFVLSRNTDDNFIKTGIVDDSTGDCLNDDNDIGNRFNSYFSSVGDLLSSQITVDAVDPEYFLSDRIGDVLSLNPTNEEEVVELVACLNDTAAG